MPYANLTHATFGYTLLAAGLSKLLDVYLPPLSDQPRHHLTPFLLTVAGVMYFSSSQEELHMVLSRQIDHGSFALLQTSVAGLIYLYFNLLSELYKQQAVHDLDQRPGIDYEAVPLSQLLHHSASASDEEVLDARYSWSPPSTQEIKFQPT